MNLKVARDTCIWVRELLSFLGKCVVGMFFLNTRAKKYYADMGRTLDHFFEVTSVKNIKYKKNMRQSIRSCKKNSYRLGLGLELLLPLLIGFMV